METKASPAALLLAFAPLDDGFHQRVESAPRAECDHEAAGDPTDNWQFSHSVVALLRFVDENTTPESGQTTVCSPPTWDACRVVEEMMQLRDQDLRAVVMAEVDRSARAEWHS